MDHHLSQGALACLVGTTKSVISRLESGHRAPTVATLHKVASVFDRQLVVSFEVPVASASRRRVAGAIR
jgi:transcriptional regulator with XRE-family HTH domain